jgi:hydroxymethylpyrimidine pyrophosphatase-like HAD family hydrolase
MLLGRAAKERILPKLVASDLDGTLLYSDGNAGYGTLSPRAIKAVALYRRAGGLFAIATGNPPEVVQELAEKLGCAQGYHVCSDGDIVIKAGKVVRRRERPGRELAAIIPRIRTRFPNLGLALNALMGEPRRSYATKGFEDFYRAFSLQTIDEAKYNKQMETIREKIQGEEMDRPEELFEIQPESLAQSFMAIMYVPGMAGEDLLKEVKLLMTEESNLIPSTFGFHLIAESGMFSPCTSAIMFEAPESNKQGALDWVCEQLRINPKQVEFFPPVPFARIQPCPYVI